jgi:nitroreductase
LLTVCIATLLVLFLLVPVAAAELGGGTEAGHAAQNIHLEFVALGLGSVAVSTFNDDELHRVLGLAKDESPLYLIPVGEPGQHP